ncbi:MAG: APC family permease [Caulobacteraceae bacterium]|nr:APC family permease [Caulobacteraceae bacterium]
MREDLALREIDAAPATLNRVLGPVGVLLLSFSALSPVFSVYIGGNEVLRMAGTGAAIAFLVGGLVSATLALLYAEVGAAFPGAGGIYPSLSALLGRFLTFPYIVLMLPITLGQISFAALGLADYIRFLAPSASYWGIAFGGLAAAAVIAILNIRHGAFVTGIFLAVEAAALGVLVTVALTHPARGLGQLLSHPVMLSHGALQATPLPILALATVSGVWSCGGASWAMYFAEEMHDARRKIGRVIAWTGVFASVTIATPMILMLLSARDIPGILSAETPFAAFLKATGGPVIAAVVSVGVSAAIFNSIIATIMAYSRYLYATGRDGIWPGPMSRVLGRLSKRFQTPLIASLILTVGSGLMALLGERTILVLISGNVSDYLLISLALFVGRRKGLTGRDFRAPAHPFVPLFGLTVTALSILADWLDKDAGRPSILLLMGLFLGALVYYHFRLRQASAHWTIGGADTEMAPAAE